MNPQDKTQAAPEAESFRLNSLEAELARLKASLEKENRGVVGWSKRWGAVLALLVAFVAVPRGALDLYHILWGRPHTELVPGNYVVMGYNPREKSVSFTLGFGVENSGTKDDFVNDLGATLKNTSAQPSESVAFESTDIECASQGIAVAMPYPLHTATPISMSCKLEKPGFDSLERSGTYQIEVHVSGAASKKETLSYCFDLGDRLIAEFNASATPATKTILKNPGCEEP